MRDIHTIDARNEEKKKEEERTAAAQQPPHHTSPSILYIMEGSSRFSTTNQRKTKTTTRRNAHSQSNKNSNTPHHWHHDHDEKNSRIGILRRLPRWNSRTTVVLYCGLGIVVFFVVGHLLWAPASSPTATGGGDTASLRKLVRVNRVTEQQAIEDAQSLLTTTFLFPPECSWQCYYDRYYVPGSKLQYNEQSVIEHYTEWNTKFSFETKLVRGRDCTCH